MMGDLKNTQKWVQGVITNPNGVIHGAENTVIDGEIWQINDKILPSNFLTSQQRIGIYNHSYFARLVECFRAEYKGLLNALGAKLFEHLTWCFLQEYPSTSYTLNDLGKCFPNYLAASLSESLNGKSPDSWQLFIIDMAKFERKYTEVYNGFGHESISSNVVGDLESIKLSPAVATLQLQFPISTCIGRFRENDTNTFPEPEPCNYVFSRQGYRVHVQLIDTKEWKALQKWMDNPVKKCNVGYQEKWLKNGIAYH